MATKFLDYTGLSYLWGKIKAWCNATFVHLTTDEDITGTKTFVGSKKIAFKQNGANDKLGFTLYNNSSKEQGYLEYNPTNKIANVPLFTLGNYATATNELSYIGFRRYSSISGASGAYNLLAPLISDAKTPFNLTTTYTNFYLPLGISDGTSIVTASNSGVVDISSLFPSTYASSAINLLTGYTKPNSGSALATTDTLNEALGKLEAKVDAVDHSNVVHKTGDEYVGGIKTFENRILGKALDVERNVAPSAAVNNVRFCFNDKNDNPLFGLYDQYAVNKAHQVSLICYDGIATAYNHVSITAGFNENGGSFCRAQSGFMPTDRHDNDIVTRDWLFLRRDTATIYTSRNLNNMVHPGTFYLIADDIGWTNIPSGWVNGILHVYADASAAHVKQVIYRFGSLNSNDHHTCIRERQDGSWSDWVRNITFKDIVPIANGGTGATTAIDAMNAIGAGAYYSSGSYNFNDFNKTGIYTFPTSVTLSNVPSGTNGTLIVFSTGAGEIARQFWIRSGTLNSNDHNFYFRTYFDSTWSNWHKIYTNSDTIPIVNGGTGATDRLNAVKNLFNSSVGTNTTDFLTVTSGFASVGYATVSNVKSVLGLGSAAYTASTAYVQTAGANQNIAGEKLFTGTAGSYGTLPNFHLANSRVVKGSNAAQNNYGIIDFTESRRDGNDSKYRLGCLQFCKYSTGSCFSELQTYVDTKDSTNAYSICLGYNASKSWEFRPNTNNVLPLGTGSYKWTQLFANTATISTSDERLKNSIDYISEELLDLWDSISFNQFKFNDAVENKGLDNARIHSGVIAQQIKSLFEENNINVNKYAFFCYDSWDETNEEKDDDGNILMAYQAAGDAYAIRYEELLCIEAAYQRRKNKILENRISELERQVSDMLQILQSLKGAN